MVDDLDAVQVIYYLVRLAFECMRYRTLKLTSKRSQSGTEAREDKK